MAFLQATTCILVCIYQASEECCCLYLRQPNQVASDTHSFFYLWNTWGVGGLPKVIATYHETKVPPVTGLRILELSALTQIFPFFMALLFNNQESSTRSPLPIHPFRPSTSSGCIYPAATFPWICFPLVFDFITDLWRLLQAFIPPHLTVGVPGSLWPKGVKLLFGVLVIYSGLPYSNYRSVTGNSNYLLSLLIRVSNNTKTLTYIQFITVFPYCLPPSPSLSLSLSLSLFL
jgi:hypothetical protein